MSEIQALIAGSGVGLFAALVIIAGVLFSAPLLTRPDRGKRPGRPLKPEEPPRPDTDHLDRAEAVADHEADSTKLVVDSALAGDGGSDNPHGLAAALNNRPR